MINVKFAVTMLLCTQTNPRNHYRLKMEIISKLPLED